MSTAPNISPATRAIVNCGSQILLPFDAGDAQVTFSRWKLAELIEEALDNTRRFNEFRYNVRITT